MSVLSVSQRLIPNASTSPSTITRGLITTLASLDRETMDSYQLMLLAQDNSTSPLSTVVPLIVTVVDRNDNLPVFAQSMWNLIIEENINSGLIMEFNVSQWFYDACNWLP